MVGTGIVVCLFFPLHVKKKHLTKIISHTPFLGLANIMVNEKKMEKF